MAGLAARDWDQWTSLARLVVTDSSSLDLAIEIAHRELGRIDLAASRFRDDSELMTLGRDHDGGVQVSALLAELLRAALRAAELTGGAVDPTVGAAVAAAGYDRDISIVLRDDAPLRAVVRRVPGWRTLRLEGDRLFRAEGVALDLGATAKAFAADRIATMVANRLSTGVLVSLGGDIATAGRGPEGGWRIRVQDISGDPETLIALSPGSALATSSTLHRAWTREGAWFNHVIDPDTGLPVGKLWRTVSAVAGSCVEANTITTAALVKGVRAPSWIRSTGRPARLVHDDRDVLLLNNWPAECAA